MATQPTLAMIPSGYKDGKLYSVLPSDGVGDFDVTRGSNATRINKDGLIETVSGNTPRLDYPLIDGVVSGCPSLLLEPTSTNLITQSEAFASSYWTKSGASIEGDASTAGAEVITVAADRDFSSNTGFWTIESPEVVYGTGKVDFNTSLTNWGFYKNSLLQANKNYIVTFDIVNFTSGSVYVNGGGTAYGSASANGMHTIHINSNSNGLLGIQSRSGGAVLSVDNISVKEVQGFASPSADTPLGAFKLVESSQNEDHLIKSSTGITVSTGSVTHSYLIKSYGVRYIALFDASVAEGVFFDLDLGVVGSDFIGSTDSSSIKLLGNEFYRISITVTVTSTASSPRLYLSNNGSTVTYQGDGTSGVYIFGAQLEQKSYATSYIKSNSGSTTTRLADTANNAGNASTFNDSEGVLMVEISSLVNSESYRLISLNDNSNSNQIFIGFIFNTGKLYYNIDSGGSGQSNFISNVTALNTSCKVCVKYKQNDISFYVNGFKLYSDSSANMPTGLSVLKMSRGNETLPFYGKTKQLQYYNTALTDLELETLTSFTSFNEMALNFNYTI